MFVCNLRPNFSFLVHFGKLFLMLFTLPSDIFDSIDHAIFVTFLVAGLVSVQGFDLFLLGGMCYLCPDIDWHQLHWIKVGRLETTAHGEGAFAHVVAFVEVSDVAITHTTFFVSVSDVRIVKSIIVLPLSAPSLVVDGAAWNVPILQCPIVTLLSIVLFQLMLK